MSTLAPPDAAALIGVEDAAELIGVAPRTIRRRIDDGTLPAFRVGPKNIRVSRDDVLALVQPARPSVEGIEQAIAALIATAPPLSSAQRDRLAGLLRPAAGAEASPR